MATNDPARPSRSGRLTKHLDATVRTTRRLPRSIRETVPPSELTTHTEPAATATRPTTIAGGRRQGRDVGYSMLDGLSLEQEGEDFGVEAGRLSPAAPRAPLEKVDQ
jgi:hypothetical protein